MLRKKYKRYYTPNKADMAWSSKFKEWFLSYKPVPSFPPKIQIQTITGCNATCIFCPHGKTKNPFPQGKMEDDLYRRIIDECLQHKLIRISPYLMNESLRDRKLGWKIKYIADRKLPSLSIKINTNASLLHGEMAEQILGSGLDRLNISFHGISKEVYEKSMQGLDYEKTLNNVNNFLDIKRRRGIKKPKVTITMIRTKWVDSEEDEIRKYWSERNVSVHIRPLENRANRSIENRGIHPKQWQPYPGCKRLFKDAYILFNGDMVLCCVDWERTTILGNVKEKSIEEVWNGEKAVSIRKRFLSGDLTGILCHSCLKQDN